MITIEDSYIIDYEATIILLRIALGLLNAPQRAR